MVKAVRYLGQEASVIDMTDDLISFFRKILIVLMGQKDLSETPIS